MDDAGASTDDGAAIQVFACNDTAAQSWTWNSADGTLRALNKCLDVRRRDHQRNAASALGLQRHRRAGMALATADPTRESAVGPLLECRRGKRRRRREA
jgi:hypothetical protein